MEIKLNFDESAIRVEPAPEPTELDQQINIDDDEADIDDAE